MRSATAKIITSPRLITSSFFPFLKAKDKKFPVKKLFPLSGTASGCLDVDLLPGDTPGLAASSPTPLALRIFGVKEPELLILRGEPS
jgi:hypothetical protein